MFRTTWQLREAHANEAFLDEVKLCHFLILVVYHSVFIVGEEHSRLKSVSKFTQQSSFSGGTVFKVYLSEETRKVSKYIVE